MEKVDYFVTQNILYGIEKNFKRPHLGLITLHKACEQRQYQSLEGSTMKTKKNQISIILTIILAKPTG